MTARGGTNLSCQKLRQFRFPTETPGHLLAPAIPPLSKFQQNNPGTPSAGGRQASGLTNLKSKSPIERQILDYLAANPTAEDTVRGITEWWLLKQRISESKAMVEAVLAKLVAKGELRAVAGPDGQIHYQCACDRAKD